MKNIKSTLLVLALSFSAISCSDDFVESTFYQSVQQKPITSSTEAAATVRGIYTSMRSSSYLGRDYILFAEVRSDEMASNGRGGYFNSVRRYDMLSADAYASDTYAQIYTAVGKANILINNDISLIQGDSDEVNKTKFYQGQAQVLRAVLFFDLLKLYGQKYTKNSDKLGIVLPLVYDPTARQARSSISETESQIEKDFKEGLALMESNSKYNNLEGSTELTINAAKAYMSRYFLYKEDYATVRSLVQQLYGKYSVIPQSSYLDSWTPSGSTPNVIFQLAVGTAGSLGTTSIGAMYLTSYQNTVVRSALYNKYSSEDIRKNLINESMLLRKYAMRDGSDNIKLIRYEEILLNGVEAELNGGDSSLALKYYNEILTNRGLEAVSSVTMTDLKAERAKELVGEGFRMWDLLRWGDTTSVLLGTKDINKVAFPIPRSITDQEGSPVKSNPGYDN